MLSQEISFAGLAAEKVRERLSATQRNRQAEKQSGFNQQKRSAEEQSDSTQTTRKRCQEVKSGTVLTSKTAQSESSSLAQILLGSKEDALSNTRTAQKHKAPIKASTQSKQHTLESTFSPAPLQYKEASTVRPGLRRQPPRIKKKVLAARLGRLLVKSQSLYLLMMLFAMSQTIDRLINILISTIMQRLASIISRNRPCNQFKDLLSSLRPKTGNQALES